MYWSMSIWHVGKYNNVSARERSTAWGVRNREEAPSLHYKRGYFIDWNVCDALKKHLLPKADYWLDTHIPGMPKK